MLMPCLSRVDEDKQGPRQAGSALVRRRLTRIYSPGTLLDPAMLVSEELLLFAFGCVE